MIERQELHCHSCNRYVQFDIDVEMDGNYVLNCPVCDHEHCRVVNNGVITDERWDQRNNALQTYLVNSGTTSYSTYSVDSTSTASSSFTNDLWINSVTSSSTGYF